MSVAGQTGDLRSLLAACAAIVVFGFAFGMSYPLLSLVLEQRGVAPEMIGINAAMVPIGVLLFAPLIPIAATRFGTRTTAVTAATITALLLLGYKAFDNLSAWFVIRLFQGMASSVLFVLSEAWIVRFSPARYRGRVVALYGSVLAASFAAGPAMLGWVGIEGWTPFLLGAAVLFAGIPPLLLVRDEPVPAAVGRTTASLLEFAGRNRELVASVFVFAILDAATLSLLPIYGLRLGLDVVTAAAALSAMIAGSVLLEFPIGWFADRYSKEKILAACAVLTAVLFAILPLTMATPLMWPNLVLAGAAGYGVYTVALAELGDRYSGSELVAGSAAFASTWGLGALVGSTAGGFAMAGLGPGGLPALLCGSYLFLLAVLALTRSSR